MGQLEIVERLSGIYLPTSKNFYIMLSLEDFELQHLFLGVFNSPRSQP